MSLIESMTEAQIEEMLRSEVVGRIGCHADGRTYVVPIIYVYDAGSIYGHSTEGLKLRLMRANPAVCFEIDRVEDLLNWKSVIVQGVFQELHGDEAGRTTEMLMDRLRPLMPTAPSGTGHATPHGDGAAVQPVVVYRIRVTERSGRFERH